MWPISIHLMQTNNIMFTFCIYCFLFIPQLSLQQDEDIPHNEVKNWALKFGVDLWEFGRQFTKMNEIQRKYHEVEVDVVRKDGLILIREMAVEVKNMMDFKMSAVLRIMDSAEQAALSPKPGTAVSGTDGGAGGSASSSNSVSGNGGGNGGNGNMRYYNAHRLAGDGRLSNGGREVILSSNRHFDHLPVNTSISSVLMPATITDADPEIQNSIQWSEHLDPLFANNYETDPSLSWQYFGSSLGFLRRYPAIAWPPDDAKQTEKPQRDSNIYDFRHSHWFVDAATSSKDLVILLDASGSMTGQRSELARATVNEILDTLDNNDYVNVFKFSDITEEVVPCFKDSLVQANPENKRDLKNALDKIRPENIANFTSALVTAFEMLHKYNRTGQGCQCNQAIMLITDGPPSTFQDIFQMYNMPHRLVRMFTYLIGKDSSNAAEMSFMACNNKGYYKRISSLEDVRDSVLQYIFVMARPMVMYQNNHPIQWTPVYMGGKSASFRSDAPMQLMTSVTTPVFDRRNHSVRVANLLGVVGTDVPIEQIIKLVPPYKLGVNGYSFIVNNNGHVLYHPDLRPLKGNKKYEKNLQPEYTSIDLTEVELVENESGPRENNSLLLDLRHEMIDQKEGEIELSVKVHYDDMKRVTTRKHKYFYNPIEGTPFSLGLAIPEGYGMYEVVAEQEIKHSPINVTEYFKGTNWKVHPDWIYCEYNSITEQWLDSAEDRVLHFLTRSRAPGWKWMSMRPRAPPLGPTTSLHGPIHHIQPTATHKKNEKDSYYCDKTLMQSLVQDAIVTEGLDKHSPTHSTHKEDKQQGYQMFGVTLSFIATRSGLLRWMDHSTQPLDSDEPHFSESNTRATDETWYRRAVDQHSIEPESFVFSVPFGADEIYKKGGMGQHSPLVTATHAIFIERKGHRAPAAVVGLQFQHATLASHFINITSACTGTTACRKTCASDELDCYVLDNNGFIILSENPEHTGKFFGQIDGTIMDSLVQDRIYKKVAVYDYQGACSTDKNHVNCAVKAISPFQSLGWFVEWVIGTISFWFSIIGESYAKTYPDEDDYYTYDNPTDESDLDSQPEEPGSTLSDNNVKNNQPELPDIKDTPTTRIHTASNNNPGSGGSANGGGNVGSGTGNMYPCDKRVDLYILQPDRLNTSGMSNPLKGKLTNCHITGCERPFSVQKIPHSNLILLVVDTLCPCGSKQLSIGAYEVLYDPNRCRTKPLEALYRRRPPKCINYHPEEIEIEICGGGNGMELSILLLTLALFLSILSHT